ncbi:vWA domain-containing protein [Jeotgalibacillus salarius]|uniref:VWFA domain-containing protein n=1 Tax=Jeotgalibacillus salarius TaxID=546023 RepID=A0A4Y8LIW6_9BACL|nr:hypothetical protein [Jeotgalibacillus salarius]TFE02970.1 hypothetical protein E2626_03945 [Jeotgalibacillus salarius]
MQRFIQFNDEQVNSFRLMQLIDLAKTLTKEKEMTVEYSPMNYLDVPGNTLFVSHFWDHRSELEEWHGLITDVFLRAEGAYKHSDPIEIQKFIQYTHTLDHPSFAKQLFMLIEDARLEEITKKKRPGTKKAFATRRSVYFKYFNSQLNVHKVKGVTTDAFFNLIYLLIFADSPIDEWPHVQTDINRAKPFITQQIEKAHETSSTADTIKICKALCEVTDELLAKDMLNEYFHLPEKTINNWAEGLTFEDLKRKDELINDDVEKEKPTGNEEVEDEEFKAWHRESEEEGESFLQFELESGTKTSIDTEAAREGDDQEQALGSVQGSSKKSQRQEFDEQDAERKSEETNEGGSSKYGKENEHAFPVFENPDIVKDQEKLLYQQYKKDISLYQKKLQKIIEKTLDHKKTNPRDHLVKGRLSKNLIPYFTDEKPRIFYKKDEESPKIDAAFELLLDCSASMFDKMDETKKGLVLFHEALKSVQVPHEITGFWESTPKAGQDGQPNHFRTVISFDRSLYQGGEEIMQLEPEEDNRDGYAIRHMTERLEKRTEKQKFLLVFSDGEPAAADYEQNGIVDTHDAVLSARKRGIEVMNVFLSTSEIPESQKEVIQNIYGRFSLFVQNIDELPDILFPLLKRLLYKSI